MKVIVKKNNNQKYKINANINKMKISLSSKEKHIKKNRKIY